MDGKEVFKLDRMLGWGSFGTTYLANVIDEKRKRDWGEVVVIKIPHNRDKEKILIQELNLNFRLSETKSENLVKYLGFDLFDNIYVMVMEFIDGETLRSRIEGIEHQQQLEISEALNITRQICKGLIEIHRCRILHRGIQPDGVIISKNNIIKIFDFGTCTSLEPYQLDKSVLGSFAYKARETLRGEGSSYNSDIYSLGVTLYEMITGELPFKGDTISEVLFNICESQPVPPIMKNNKISIYLNELIMKALSKNVNDRYQSASEFSQALGYVS